MHKLKRVIAVGQIFWVAGCVNLPYYVQAVDGHLDMMRRSQPISTIIANPEADHQLKRILARVVMLRGFASRELMLPNNQSYTHYADLNRPYVVWNVFASPELSLELKKWCFIKAGCVSYRGFFSQARAERYAAELREEGYDVYVGGVRAYSTLGWFNDPVLNTFIGYSEMELARMIFHELAHQVVYVPGDSVFNESFATAVEHEGIGRWFESNGAAAERVAFHARHERETVFTRLILNHRKRLHELFSSELSDAEKRAAKAHIFAELREEFSQLKTARTEFSSYDRWFAQELNNARLATVSIYTQLLPAFQALLAQQNGDMGQFFKVVKEISKLPQDERISVLQATVEGGAGAVIVSNVSFELRD
ncbi:MAG: aminopeptidase [Nitrosomonas sp.]|nr:aminopeptidase [Nitrosomonas sp.]